MAHADETKRPSRRGWPVRTRPATTPAGTHEHELPGWLFRAVIGLAVTSLLILVAVCVLLVYVLGRGAYRDEQTEHTREEVREQLCAVLDGLPQGGVLDLTRDKLGCGPGVPFDQLPPETQRRLTPPPAPAATVAPTSPPAVTPVPAPAPVPSAEPPPPAAQPPAPDTAEPLPGGTDGPMTPAEPPPLSPPSQVRELLCDLLSVCSEESP